MVDILKDKHHHRVAGLGLLHKGPAHGDENVALNTTQRKPIPSIQGAGDEVRSGPHSGTMPDIAAHLGDNSHQSNEGCAVTLPPTFIQF